MIEEKPICHVVYIYWIPNAVRMNGYRRHPLVTPILYYLCNLISSIYFCRHQREKMKAIDIWMPLHQYT